MTGRNTDEAYRLVMDAAATNICRIVAAYGLAKAQWGPIEGLDCDGRLIRYRVVIEGYEPTGPKADRIKAELVEREKALYGK